MKDRNTDKNKPTVKIGANSKLITLKPGKKHILTAGTLSNETATEQTPERWIWIATDFLEKAKTIDPGQVYQQWGEWKKHTVEGPVDAYGINMQYTIGGRIEITGKKHRLTEGTILYFENFLDTPTLNDGYYLATVDEPKIMRAAFAKYQEAFMYPGEEPSDVYSYKNVVRLYIKTHLIPDYTVNYQNFAVFKVDIYDKESGSKVNEEPLQFFQKTHFGKFSVNTLTRLDIQIKEEWRDASGHEPGNVKTYYAKINTTIYRNEGAFTNKNVPWVDEDEEVVAGQTFGAVAPNGEITAVEMGKDDIERAKEHNPWDDFWFGISESAKKKAANHYTQTPLEEYDTSAPEVALEGQQPAFTVRYGTMDVILEEYEADKKNMLAVVGDVECTQRSGEPCKYSALEVSMPGSDRKPVTLFDENMLINTVNDETARTFGLVAGDEKKTVTITARGLVIQDYQAGGADKPKCFGITASNALPGPRITAPGAASSAPQPERTRHEGDEEFIHNSIEDVFPVEQVHAIDPLYNVPEIRQGTGHGDTSVDITKQMLEHSYTKNGIELKLGYFYNKTIADGSWISNDVLDLVWFLKYLWPNEDHAQTYFIPATTCRYPNQTIKIKVYPDIEWEIVLKYNYKSSLGYNHGNLSDYAVEGTQEKYENLAKQDHNLETQGATLGKFKFALFNPKIDEKDLLKLELEFAEKIRKVCSTFYKMKKMADKVAYGTEGGADLLRKKKFPFDFELKSPSTGIRVKWGMKPSKSKRKNHLVGIQGSLDWLATPLIGADLTLKIHELIKYIPHPVARLIDAIITGINSIKSKKIEAKFEVNLIFSGDLKINLRAFEINAVNSLTENRNITTKKSYVKGVFTVKLGIDLMGKGKVRIPWTEYKFNFGGKAEAYLKAYWDAKLYLSNQKNGLYGQFSGGFSGLKGVVIVEVYVGPATIPVYDKEDTFFKPDDINPESNVNKDDGQKSMQLPLIESSNKR